MTVFTWNEMNINVRVIRRKNIGLSIKDSMLFERHDTYGKFLKSTLANV